MANFLITLAHPNRQSLNGAIADTIAEVVKADGGDVRINDLYAKGFDCCLDMKDFESWGKGELLEDVKAEQADVDWADVLAFVYPIWWNERPAKLKGWCDRVLTKGWAWDFNEQGLVQKLTGKRGFVSATYGSPEALYDHLGTDIEKLRQPMEKGTLNFCGITDVTWVEEFNVLGQDRAANEAYVQRVGEAVKGML